jgi:hypothetical protein
VGVGPTRSEAAVEPLGGPAFEPLISREARSLVPSRGRIPLGVSPFPVPVARDREREKREKRIRNRAMWRTFFWCGRVGEGEASPAALLDVPSVAVDLALTVGQLVRSGLQNLGDDEWPFPRGRELVPPSGVLPQSKHQVAYLEVSGSDSSGVVASQGLLIPRRV